MIDWSRIAEPTGDGSDTEAVLAFLEREPMPWHPPPPHRTAAPAAAPRLPEGPAVWIDTPILPGPRFAPLTGLPEGLVEAVALVRRWPAMAAQWPRIVHTVQCFTDTVATAGGATPAGSSSHNLAARFGVIALTVDSPPGAAQAIVHEAAHHKLRALGVDNERAVRLIVNPPDALYASPIVVDRPRPMTAVLHAQYSFIHVTELDLWMLAAEDDPLRALMIRTLLSRNVPRMEAGADVIRRHARTDDAGAAFLDGFLAWTDRVLEAGRAALAEPVG